MYNKKIQILFVSTIFLIFWVSMLLPSKGFFYLAYGTLCFSIISYLFNKLERVSTKQKATLLLLAISPLLISIVFGYFLDSIPRLAATLIVFIFLKFYLIQYLRLKGMQLFNFTLYLISPYLFIATNYSVFHGDIKYYPLGLAPFIAFFYPIFIKRIAVSTMAFVFAILILSFEVYPRYLDYLELSSNKKTNLYNPLLANAKFVDQYNDTLSLIRLDNDIIVLDFWFSKCQPCFKNFPNLQQLTERYKTDKRVLIAAMNSPMDGDTISTAFDLIRQYHFTKFKDLGSIYKNSWNITSYPTLMVFDKKRNLRYKGHLYFSDNPYNIYDLIERLKME